jgi:hypothetical protein
MSCLFEQEIIALSFVFKPISCPETGYSSANDEVSHKHLLLSFQTIAFLLA